MPIETVASPVRRKDPGLQTYYTLAELRAETHHNTGNLAVLTGGTTAHDLTPAGLYSYDADEAGSDNSTSIIKPTDVSGNGRWNRVAAP